MLIGVRVLILPPRRQSALGRDRGQSPLPLLERSQIIRHVSIFRRQRFNIANFKSLVIRVRNIEHRTVNVQLRRWTFGVKEP